MNIFSKIEQRTVDKEVVDLLREAIISGDLSLGAHLPETEMASQMAVSRIPIREALRQLEQEGLVVRHPNRGCFVISFSDHDVQEVFSLRSMLEAMAFEWAIPNLVAKDYLALQSIIDDQRQAVLNEDYKKLAYLDMHFHEYICNKAGHSRLLKTWYEQHAQCQILLNLRFQSLADYTPDTALNDHAAILAALRAGKAEAAARLTLEISERVSRECIETLHQVTSRLKTRS